MPYNYKDLRDDLTDYYGTAMTSGNPMAIMELSRIQQLNDEELLSTAQQNGFDLSKYNQNAWGSFWD